MVELGGAASGFVVNARLVELEGVVGSIDGNTDGTNSGASSLEVRFASLRDGLEAGDERSLVGDVVSALQGTGSLVRIAGFAVDTVVLDDVLESVSHFTTLATIISERGRAVDEVLLRETNKGVSRKLPLAFHGASGREGPARSTLSLVLDWGDSTSVSPVDASWEADRGISDEQVVLGEGRRALVTVHSSTEFSVGEVTEVVHGELNSGLLGVVLTDELQVLLEDLETSFFLIDGGVGAGVLDLPLAEDTTKSVIMR